MFGILALVLATTYVWLAAPASTAGTGGAQTGAWSRVDPRPSPPARDRAAMAYHPSPDRPADAHVVLFGGYGDAGPTDDTWIWRNGAWTSPNPLPRPSKRAGASLAYDGHQMVLFGGEAPAPTLADPNATVPLNDTWIWNGTDWTRTSPDPAPLARSGASMALDANSGRVVLFGGRGEEADGSRILFGDTWLWDGVTRSWESIEPVPAPAARYEASSAADEGLRNVLLFGGDDGVGPQGDTWVFHSDPVQSGDTPNGHWTEVDGPQPPATSPAPRRAAAMAYEPKTGKVVMFGGIHAGPAPTRGDETWTWTGAAGQTGSWHQGPAVGPSPRDGAALAADPKAPASVSTLMLFGGFGGAAGVRLADTWVWDGAAPATTSTTTTSTSRPTTSTTIPAPVVRNLTPNSGPEAGGTQVTISGTSLVPARSVGFGVAPEHQIDCAQPGRCNQRPDGTIVVVSPPHAAGVVNVVVTTARGRSSSPVGQHSADDFTFTADGRGDPLAEVPADVAVLGETEPPFDSGGGFTGDDSTGGFSAEPGFDGGYAGYFAGLDGAAGAAALGGLGATLAPPVAPGAPPPPGAEAIPGFVPPSSPASGPVGGAAPGSGAAPRGATRWMMVRTATEEPAATATLFGAAGAFLLFCYQVARRRPPGYGLAPAADEVTRPAHQEAY